MSSKTSLPLLLVLAATPALGATATNWRVDAGHSKIDFVASMNGQAINGNFKRFDTKIAFDPQDLADSSVTAEIDTSSAFTGDETRDEALPSPDWFNSKLFPRAIFHSKSFKATGANAYEAAGTLTIRDKTVPVSLPFTLTIDGSDADMQGTITLDRRTFGVGQGQFAGTDAVAADVTVTISLHAHR